MLIVTGPSCSGKSTFGRIARSSGALVVETTDVVKEAFGGSNALDKDIIEFCVRRYREAGEDVFALLNHERILRERLDARRLVCVGFRAAGEVECFKRLLPPVRVVGIYADTSIRYRRGLLRDRADCSKTLEEFIHRDMREYSMGLATLFSRMLDAVILNNGLLSEFEQRVEEELFMLLRAGAP